MKLTLDGRTDLESYFELSGIRDYSKLSHTPFLVFVASKTEIKVEIVDGIKKLLKFPDDTKVMNQWQGQWKSDFFQFTIKDLKTFIKKNPKTGHQQA